MKIRFVTSTLTSLMFLIGYAGHLFADDLLEEIIVTAQKREQSLQDVPISVATFSADYLLDFDIHNWGEIMIPGVFIGQGARNESLYVRGVGSGTNFGFEQSVPVYIDGTYFGRARAENIGFLDVQRIEILKGPQPIFFGHNAIAGALSIISARPTAELESYVNGTYEFESNETSVSAALSGPLSDRLRARAALSYENMDGWMENAAAGNRPSPQTKEFAGRISAELDITDSLKAFAKYEHSYAERYGRNRQLVFCGVTNTNENLVASRVNFAIEDCQFNDTLASTLSQAPHPTIPIEGDWDYISKLTYDGGQIDFDWDLDSYMLSATTSYYKVNYRTPQNDTDATSNEIGAIATTDVDKQFSQEIRLTSTSDERLQWVVGFYYDNADLTTSGTGDLYVAFPVPVSPALFQNAAQTTKSWSGFGEIAFRIAEPFTIKLGGRYTEVKKDAQISLVSKRIANGNIIDEPFRPGPPGSQGPILFPPFDFDDNLKNTKFQPAITLEWRPVDDTMLYLSWKQGFKAGGYDQDSLTIPPSGTLGFEPETVDALEAGAKTRMMDGRATINIAMFRSDYDDLQVSIFTGTIGFFTTNAAKARSQGVELDGAFAASDKLTFNGSVTYLDSKYTNFPAAPCNAPQTLTTPTPPPCTQVLTGKHTQFAPEWSGTVGAKFNYPLATDMFGSNLIFVGRADLFFTTKYNTSNGQDPLTVQSGFSKIDARLGFGAADGKWELAFVGRNLTNEKTSHWTENAVMGPLAVGVAYQTLLDRTRQLGIQAIYNF